MFGQPKPRGFHHEFIYIDERKERLKAIERKAREELSGRMNSSALENNSHRLLKEGMYKYSRRSYSHLQMRKTLLQGMLLGVLLLFLAVVLFYLMRK
ncbi:MAG TPA: hypothetical protein VIR50_00220 [Prevotella sp.]